MRDPLPPILPVGTAVVVLVDVRGSDGRVLHPRGTPGTIVKSPPDPEHSYRVEFLAAGAPDGEASGGGGADGGGGASDRAAKDHASLRRREIEVLAHFSAAEFGIDPLLRHDLSRHVIYRCVVGSRAFGLDHDESDTDRRGIYLPPAAMHWSIFGVPEQLENDATQEVYWELEKFLRLALKANPNVLETLYSPLVEHATDLARELLAMRGVFLSRLVYQTFSGYAMSQFKKLEGDLRNKGQIKWKHAMHLLRLLLSGTTALRTGELPVLVDARHRERLIEIRDGRVPWGEVDAWRVELHRDFEAAFADSKLPERPEYERVNGFLVRARRAMVSNDGARPHGNNGA